jgi:REP element-mobilizing transposase RayT
VRLRRFLVEKSRDLMPENNYCFNQMVQVEMGFEVAGATRSVEGSAAAAAGDASSKKTPTKRGGFRPNAGRKPTGRRRDPLHVSRPELKSRFPVHVVLRTRKDVPRLRRGPIYRALRKVLGRQLGKLGFRVCHVSIQHNHLHFLVEAGAKDTLTRGMQGLAISAAKAINRVCKRKGKVFEFRYHATQIRSPRQARHALAYVLNNWRRHKEDERAVAARFAAIDPYSTARQFTGWTEAHRAVMPRGFKTFDPLEVSEPRTWLLSVGWKKRGTISAFETPGRL